MKASSSSGNISGHQKWLEITPENESIHAELILSIGVKRVFMNRRL